MFRRPDRTPSPRALLAQQQQQQGRKLSPWTAQKPRKKNKHDEHELPSSPSDQENQEPSEAAGPCDATMAELMSGVQQLRVRRVVKASKASSACNPWGFQAASCSETLNGNPGSRTSCPSAAAWGVTQAGISGPLDVRSHMELLRSASETSALGCGSSLQQHHDNLVHHHAHPLLTSYGSDGQPSSSAFQNASSLLVAPFGHPSAIGANVNSRGLGGANSQGPAKAGALASVSSISAEGLHFTTTEAASATGVPAKSVPQAIPGPSQNPFISHGLQQAPPTAAQPLSSTSLPLPGMFSSATPPTVVTCLSAASLSYSLRHSSEQQLQHLPQGAAQQQGSADKPSSVCVEVDQSEFERFATSADVPGLDADEEDFLEQETAQLHAAGASGAAASTGHAGTQPHASANPMSQSHHHIAPVAGTRQQLHQQPFCVLPHQAFNPSIGQHYQQNPQQPEEACMPGLAQEASAGDFKIISSIPSGGGLHSIPGALLASSKGSGAAATASRELRCSSEHEGGTLTAARLQSINECKAGPSFHPSHRRTTSIGSHAESEDMCGSLQGGPSGARPSGAYLGQAYVHCYGRAGYYSGASSAGGRTPASVLRPAQRLRVRAPTPAAGQLGRVTFSDDEEDEDGNCQGPGAPPATAMKLATSISRTMVPTPCSVLQTGLRSGQRGRGTGRYYRGYSRLSPSVLAAALGRRGLCQPSHLHEHLHIGYGGPCASSPCAGGSHSQLVPPGLDGEEADLSNLMCDEADFLTPIKSPAGGSTGSRRMFAWHDDVGEQMAADLRRTHSADASLLGTEPCSVSSIGVGAPAFLHPHHGPHHVTQMGVSLPSHISSAFALMADGTDPEPLSALQAAFQLTGPDAMFGGMQLHHSSVHFECQQQHAHGRQQQHHTGSQAGGAHHHDADMHASRPCTASGLSHQHEAAHQELLLGSRLSMGSSRFGSENDLRQLATPGELGREHEASHHRHGCPPLHMLASVEEFNVQLSRAAEAGDQGHADQLWAELRGRDDLRPNIITLNWLLRCLCKTVVAPEEAERLSREVCEKGDFEPNAKTYRYLDEIMMRFEQLQPAQVHA